MLLFSQDLFTYIFILFESLQQVSYSLCSIYVSYAYLPSNWYVTNIYIFSICQFDSTLDGKTYLIHVNLAHIIYDATG